MVNESVLTISWAFPFLKNLFAIASNMNKQRITNDCPFVASFVDQKNRTDLSMAYLCD